jgi:hypothetical protein
MSEPYEQDLPDYVTRYLLRRALDELPQSVQETLAGLSPEEIETLDRVGASLKQADVPAYGYTWIIH